MKHNHKHIVVHIVLLFCLTLLLGAPAQARDKARFLSAKDGDSLVVELHGSRREVRLIGIDAPEWGQEYGTQARSYALKTCYGKDIELEYDKDRKDRYGRLLAYVYCGGDMLNEEIVKAGYAVPLTIKPNTKYRDLFEQAQEQAKANHRGFWLRGGLKQTPREWRKSHK